MSALLKVGDRVEVEYPYGWTEGRIEGFRAGLPEEDFQRIDVSHGSDRRTVWCHPRHVRALGEDDPRDITIRTLKAEVERLAGDLSLAGSRLEGEGYGGKSALLSASAARALLKRLAAFAFLALLSLPSFAAPKAHRHVTKPLSTITVKVVAHQDFTRKLASRPGAEAPGTPWIITSHDIDSCTAWVDTTAGNVPAAEIRAFRACRTVIDLAVDSAHAADEKGGVR